MADHAKADSGKGIPGTAHGNTAQEQVHDPRLIPGGSLENAKTPIGMNAVDREDLASYGKSTDQTDDKDTPGSDDESPAHPEEPERPISAANAPGTPRP
jgi:hypothetical protein